MLCSIQARRVAGLERTCVARKIVIENPLGRRYFITLLRQCTAISPRRTGASAAEVVVTPNETGKYKLFIANVAYAVTSQELAEAPQRAWAAEDGQSCAATRCDALAGVQRVSCVADIADS